ncbi:hypothetical protein [Methylovulum miyakonense]|uniref:hypothetical protein n=1 Tax=Methylovulum miyakonense TaxID=645578 RepID=UPI00035F3581|nr:hypothetical protein [Methylovulum miyakonense]
MFIRHLIVLAALTCSSLAYAGQTGVDRSFTLFKNIDSTDPTQPTIINTVTVVCPAAGTLISNVSAQITLATSGAAGEVDLQYGITKNSVKQDINNHHIIREYTDSGTTWSSVSYQRADNCTAGQTVKIRFLANKISANAADAEKSSLVVTFIEGPVI